MKESADKPFDPPLIETTSPPCYARDFPGYFGEIPASPDPELIAGLNALLEAERAGARILAVLRDAVGDRPAAREVLDRIQKDEGANAVVLYKTIRRLGGVASHETGAFVQKTLAIDGLVERLRFINRGQGWVVRKIEIILTRAPDEGVRDMLLDMRRSHLDNIAVCDALLLDELAD